jgi:predicted nucleotide-binding protein
MSWNARELDALLTLDVDDVVDRARSLGVKDRTAALRDSLAHLEKSAEPLDRMKVLLFIQTLLALAPDGIVASSVAESAVDELAKVVVSTSESEERRRSALTSLALLPVKAKGLSESADSRLRAAFTFARESREPEISDFARRVPLRNAAVVGRSKTSRAGLSRARPRKVLVIHGRDRLNTLLLNQLVHDHWGFSAVEVKEHPASGRTFIERFEREAIGADFAIVLLSPDDLSESGRTVHLSNVVFELGWAYARLGRSRVCLLVKKGTNLPSDLEGINRIDFEETVRDVTRQLQAELESAGILRMPESA